MKKKRIIILLLAVVLLIPMVVSCTPVDDTQTSDLGRGFWPFQKHDGWIYYSASDKLYKIKPNGDEKTEISGVEVMNFVIYEDRIYYTADNERALYSSNTDGSDQTFLCEKRFRMWPTHKLYVVDDWIYCIPKYNVLCKMKTDGTQLTWLTQPINPITDFFISGEWIYYIVQDYGECRYHLYRMHTDGTQKTKLTQDTCGSRGMDFDENWIYYVDSEGGIYKQDFYISEPIKLIDCDRCSFLKVIGDWVYYNEDSAFYKVKTDGSERTKITDVIPDARFVDVWDNWLIYMDRSKNHAIAHMIRVGYSHKTDALIDKILADSTPDLEIRKYENTESFTPSDETKPTSSPVRDTKLTRSPAKDTRPKTTPTKYTPSILPTKDTKPTIVPADDAKPPTGDAYTSDFGLGLWVSPMQEYNGWVYYTVYPKGIYKIRTNGKDKALVSEKTPYSFEIYEDRIYYAMYKDGTIIDNSIYSCETDGSDVTFLCEKQFGAYQNKRLNIVDNWIYFMRNDYMLHKIKTDGTAQVQLNQRDEPILDFTIHEEWIYYLTLTFEKDYREKFYNLNRMRTDGTQKMQLTTEKCKKIDIQDNWIYYIDETATSIYKVKFDGSGKQIIADGNLFGYSCFKVIGDWVYYENGTPNVGLYRIKTDGSECIKITDVVLDFRTVNVWDNWLIYVDFFRETPMAHMIRAGDTHKTDAVIEEILADKYSDIEIRKYE